MLGSQGIRTFNRLSDEASFSAPTRAIELEKWRERQFPKEREGIAIPEKERGAGQTDER